METVALKKTAAVAVKEQEIVDNTVFLLTETGSLRGFPLN